MQVVGSDNHHTTYDGNLRHAVETHLHMQDDSRLKHVALPRHHSFHLEQGFPVMIRVMVSRQWSLEVLAFPSYVVTIFLSASLTPQVTTGQLTTPPAGPRIPVWVGIQMALSVVHARQ